MTKYRTTLKRITNFNYNWAVIPICLISATLAVSLSFLHYYRPPEKATENSVVLLEPVCSGDANSQGCLRKKYSDITKEQGAAKAFEILKADYASNTAVYNDCHQITHAIGRAVARQVGDVGKSFLEGDSFCWSGFHHGVMEVLVTEKGLDGLLASADNICRSLKESRQYSFDHYNCVHGLGHGVMALFGNELFAALDACDKLSDSWERSSCYGGVYMENIISLGDESRPSKYLDKSRPMYPCTDVLDKYKQECYMMQTSFALQSNGYNFQATYQLCSEVEQIYQATCYQSLGRDASGSTVSNVEKTINICNLGKPGSQRQNCIIGAVKDFISFYHRIEEANSFCKATQPEDFEICQSTAESYFQTL